MGRTKPISMPCPSYPEYADGIKPYGYPPPEESPELWIRDNDPINHPSHYTQHPSGVECIQITEWFNFCIGNAIKYLWRAGLKGDALQDLKKAEFYIKREIERLEKQQRKSDKHDPVLF